MSGVPSRTTITASPSSARSTRRDRLDKASPISIHATNVDTTMIAPVIDMSSSVTPCCTKSPSTIVINRSRGVNSLRLRLPVPRTTSHRNQ